MPDLTVHRLSNTHPNGLPHWAELLETVGVASYEAPEAVLSKLNYIIDKGRIFIITVTIYGSCMQLLKLGSIMKPGKRVN